MRLSLCNEVLDPMPFAQQCEFAAKVGYDGLEVAPYTLSETPERMTPAQVAEVLEVGAGDTYGAGTPGQAIDITRLRNGTYSLKIEANPSGALRETTAADNVSLRRIVLGGAPGLRTVRVPPAEGIDSERLDRRLSATCAYCVFLG